MSALAALVKVKTKEIVATYDKVPVAFVNVPGLWQAYGAIVGWASPDNAYKVVSVVPFEVPDGFQVIGDAKYTVNEDLTVNELFDTAAIPEPPKLVTYSDLLSLLTDAETANLQKVLSYDAEMFKFEKEALLRQSFRLDDPFVATIRDKLVSKNIITKARAQEIFKDVP